MLRDEPISEKVDLYGFGIMLWEMYTGKLPWSDKNYHQMIHTVAVRNERPPITPNIPRELVQIIEGCWHPVPQKRPLFSDLKNMFRELESTVPQDIPPSTTQRSDKTSSSMSVERRAPPPHQGAGAAAAPTGGQQYYQQQPTGEQHQHQQQQQRPSRMQHAPQFSGAQPSQPPVMYGGYPNQGW